MRSLLGRFHRPMSRGLVNNMLTMNNLGDGSTLSLDFTAMGGVLDPRLTFSRASTATFVNSSGYVQFANANCFTYSNPRNLTTAWNATGTVTWNGTGGIVDPIGGTNAQSITFGTAASAIFNNAGTIVTSGINHTFSVWLRAASGTTNARIGSSNTGAVSTVALTTTWQRFSCQYVTNGTNDGGAVYSQTGTASAEMYVWGAQLQPGSIVGDLIQTSGTQNYSTPRFDYSPTNIGEPRGLLVEGSSTNYFFYSALLSNVTWQAGTGAANDVTMTYPAVGITDPSNGSSAGFLSKPNTSSGYGFFRQTSMNTGTVSGNRTVSCWFKQPTSNAARYVGIRCSGNGFAPANAEFCATFDLQNGVVVANAGTNQYTNVSITAYPNGWYKCSATSGSMGTAFTAIGSVAIVEGVNGNEFNGIQGGTYIWGLQIELGSGASSYIPTGASQVTRNVDNCYMNDISSLSYSTTNGTLFYESLTTKWNISSYPARLGFTKETGDYRAFGALTDIGGMLPNVGGPAGTPTVLVSLPFTLNTNTKCAWSFDAALSTAELQATINGGAIVNSTASALTVSETPTYFGLGQKGYDLYLPCGPVKRVKYWPTTLTAAQLQTLTTP